MIELDVLGAESALASRPTEDDAPRAWRSAADRDGAPGYERLRTDEFLPEGDEPSTETSRRTFLKVMGASMAMAGLAGCRRPEETVLPYARKPEEVIPGVANYYATSMPQGGVAHGLLVESHEGRPTKVEGNPQHPVTQGKTDIFAQASLLNLYDPDRSRTVTRRGEAGLSWQRFVRAAGGMRQQMAGRRVLVLAEPDDSPTRARLREQFEQAFPNTEWITLHPQGDDPVALGSQMAFGQPLRPLYRFSDAETIVSFDGDFLGAEDVNSIWNNRQYAASRRIEERDSMSRLYMAESTMSITGGMADHRLRMKAGRVPFFAAAVAQALGRTVSGTPSVSMTAQERAVVDAIAQDVREAAGRSVFVAGASQPPPVHALCAILNRQFGQGVVDYLDTGAASIEPVGPRLERAVEAMEAGRIGMVLMLNTNPVYMLPRELNFAEALDNVEVTIHTGLHRDETAQRALWHIPAAHYLERWGDGRAYDGTLSLIQPLIAPLYEDAHSDAEVLATLATGRSINGYELVRETMRVEITGLGSFENAWRTALHDGFVAETRYPTASPSGGSVDFSRLHVPEADNVELVVRLSPTLRAGEYSNNAWMQEAPHPVTKVTWDNVAVMSRATAERLGVNVVVKKANHEADLVTLTAPNGQSIEIPAWVQPGHPDNSITTYLGYGRNIETQREIRDRNLLHRIISTDNAIYRPGPVGNGIGPSVEGLRAGAFMPVLPDVQVGAGTGEYRIASTQDHGSMEGRDIVRTATVDRFMNAPEFAKHKEHYIEGTPWDAFPPLWGEDNSASEQPVIESALYSNQQWGMTVDLNACTGCNACVVACQSENSIPVVGKDQVSRGREMHWMRLDRYYVGDDADTGMVMQPMMCQHCENAPCEQVCPVNATSHSPDGINEMTYNRCIGTRYCSNNCPYKVRRYNFYNWTKDLPVEVQMANNPDVTVRFRGVMEKCTFCVQRIRRVQRYAHINDRPVRDGEIRTACQQACPADAITFGNIADPESNVSREKANPRNYAVLAELAVKPRATYLARLRNPHPGLETPFDAMEAHGAGHGDESHSDESHAAETHA